MKIEQLLQVNEPPANFANTTSDKKAALEKLNELLNKMIKSFQNDQYPQINFKIAPLKEREFFVNLNNPYTHEDYTGKPSVIPNMLAGTLLAYGTGFLAVYDNINNHLGYPATVAATSNLTSPLSVNNRIPSSLYNAYRNSKSNLEKSDEGSTAAAVITTSAMLADGIYGSIDKMPPKIRPLAAFIGIAANFNHTFMPLVTKDNPYSAVNNIKNGTNISSDNVSLFFLADLLFLRGKKIVYLYNIALGKNIEKPKEGNVTTGSWVQDGNSFTGVLWKF